jgi:hypothetical protein
VLWELKYEYLDNRKNEPFTWVVQEVFIVLKACHVVGIEGFDSHFFLLALMSNKYLLHNIKWETNIYSTILIKDKYLLHNINGDGNIIDPSTPRDAKR